MPLFQFEMPQIPRELLIYLWRAIGKKGTDAIKISDVKYFLSYRLKLLVPSVAKETIDQWIKDKLVTASIEGLILSPSIAGFVEPSVTYKKPKKDITTALNTTGFNDYFRELFLDEIKQKIFNVRLEQVKSTPIKSTSTFIDAKIDNLKGKLKPVFINFKTRKIIHQCKRFPVIAIQAGKLCHHVAIIFRKIQKLDADFALKVISDLSINWNEWSFIANTEN
jgi:hypothetical protein